MGQIAEGVAQASYVLGDGVPHESLEIPSLRTLAASSIQER